MDTFSKAYKKHIDAINEALGAGPSTVRMSNESAKNGKGELMIQHAIVTNNETGAHLACFGVLFTNQLGQAIFSVYSQSRLIEMNDRFDADKLVHLLNDEFTPKRDGGVIFTVVFGEGDGPLQCSVVSVDGNNYLKELKAENRRLKRRIAQLERDAASE